MSIENKTLTQKYMEARENMTPLQKLVDDLYWDYESMSSSGQKTLDKLAKYVDVLTVKGK